jgi:hypothetical protein
MQEIERVSSMSQLPFEIVWPGVRLVGLGDQETNVEASLHELVRCIDACAAALQLCLWADDRFLADHQRRRDGWEHDVDRERQVELETGSRLTAMQVARRERWAEGLLPREHTMALKRIAAESFTGHLHLIGKVLQSVAGMPGAPGELNDVLVAYRARLPDLKGVRDSIQHVDERILGEARGKPIARQSVADGLIDASGGNVTVIGMLVPNFYRTTMEDGALGNVPISVSALTLARDTVQATLDAFAWQGSPYPHPQ